MDAILFAVNEKAEEASQLMNLYKGGDHAIYEFYRGQYMAFNEVYSLLKNSKL